jgi:very-short-patch-repair endonuclease
MSRFSRTPEKTARARSLRRAMTKAEWRLWYYMRGAGLGVSFRRQHPIGPYFADFYCAPLKLVIELDGGQHAQREDYDAARTAYLNRSGIQVLRFWNNDVMENLDGVCREIADAIRRKQFEMLAPDPLPTSPLQGEE